MRGRDRDHGGLTALPWSRLRPPLHARGPSAGDPDPEGSPPPSAPPRRKLARLRAPVQARPPHPGRGWRPRPPLLPHPRCGRVSSPHRDRRPSGRDRCLTGPPLPRRARPPRLARRGALGCQRERAGACAVPYVPSSSSEAGSSPGSPVRLCRPLSAVAWPALPPAPSRSPCSRGRSWPDPRGQALSTPDQRRIVSVAPPSRAPRQQRAFAWTARCWSPASAFASGPCPPPLLGPREAPARAGQTRAPCLHAASARRCSGSCRPVQCARAHSTTPDGPRPVGPQESSGEPCRRAADTAGWPAG